ncbi:MAG TPA: PAS domain S-box protein [Tepidisphaeraceae bacterium]|nr:PAS domain S-box protein [Tepidisphaeraceae bacterium]
MESCQREEIVQAVMKGINDAIFVKDQQGRYQMVNPATAAVVGRSPSELIGKDDVELFGADTAQKMRETDRQVMAANQPMTYEEVVATAGIPRHRLTTKTPYRDETGQTIGIIGISRDITELQAAQATLRSSEERYRFLAESMPQMVWSTDPEGRPLDANSRWEQYTGQSPQRVIDEGWAEAIHPEDRPHAIQRWMQSQSTGEPYKCEYRMRRASDGSYRWHLVQAVPMKDEHGQIIRWVGNSTDIHDLKVAQEAMQLNKRRLALAIDSAQIGLWDVDLITDRLTESDRRGPMFGRPLGPAHATVEDWRRDLHPDDRGRMTEAIHEAMAARADYHHEYRVIGPDGKLRWIASHGSVLRDAAGYPLRLVGVSFDVTQAKEAQQERDRLLALEREARHRAEAAAATLKESEAQMLRLNQQLQRKVSELQTLLDILPIGIAIAEDPECRVIRGNRTFTQMLGVEPDANLSKSNPASSQVLHHRYLRDGRELKSEELALQRAAATGAPVSNMTFDLVRKDGRLLQLVGSAAPLVAEDGRATGAIGVFWDIEGFRRTEERLRTEKDAAVSASIAKDRFLATLSHELRNPLSTILNTLQVAEEMSSCRDCPAVEQRTIIARQTRHLARLVDDLLDVSRVTAGKITLQKEIVDLVQVVRHSVQACHSGFQDRRQELTLNLPSQPLLVEGDSVRLEQVIMNLLSNARKYTPSGGHIWLTATAEDNETIVRVRDNGIGIPPEALPRLFQPFMQVDESLDRSQGGLGLGLALARNLVQMLGGTIAASSAGVGHGSEFIVRLPRFQGTAPRVPASPMPPQKATSRRILLVEDQADARRVLRRLLTLWGHQVEVAEDGPEAVDKAIAQSPEVALVDIGLPGFSGYEVAQRIRAALGNAIFLIALTGYGQPEDIQRASEAGFDLHLTKPIEPTRLEQLLGELHPPAARTPR